MGEQVDVYRVLAAVMYNMPYNEVTDEQIDEARMQAYFYMWRAFGTTLTKEIIKRMMIGHWEWIDGDGNKPYKGVAKHRGDPR